MTTLVVPFGKPKRTIVLSAYSDAGLSDAEFAIEPEELNKGLRTLNGQMLEWPWNLMGYQQPTYGDGSLDDPSGLDDAALNAVVLELSYRLAASLGKLLSPDVKARHAASVSQTRAAYATIPVIALPCSTPRGAGNRRLWPFSA